ncbi:DUF483 domain-containing protein [Candidatus Woesearchaeota archaeon]|nr:DUF483 domain-containing protein [Candidatus Woesearchaeota archaeon]
MLDEFLTFFKSFTKSMDIIYVIEGLKPVSRIILSEDYFKSSERVLEDYSVSIVPSDFKIKQEIDENRFSNKGVRIPANSKEKGRYFVYLSKKEELAEKAKQLEAEAKHAELGKLLGYPKCCCEFFEKNFPAESKKQNDYVLAALRGSEGFRFPFYTNVAIRSMDLNLLSHFPCNFNCEESIRTAKKHLELLKNLSPELGEITAGMLKGVVIYTDKKGIFLLRDYKIKGNEIEYGGVMSSVNNEIYDSLKRSKKMRIIDKNHIKTDKSELKGPDIGILIFS